MGNDVERNTRRFGLISDEYIFGSNERIRVDSELSRKFEVTVGMHQGSVL